MAQLDRLDYRILKMLQQDARISYQVIGNKVGLHASVVSRRVAAMVKAGVITGMHVAVDPLLVGVTTTVYMLVMLHGHGDDTFLAFERELDSMPNIVEWSRIQGVNDYVMKVQARDRDQYIKLHTHLRTLPMVMRLRSLELMGQPHTKRTPLDDLA